MITIIWLLAIILALVILVAICYKKAIRWKREAKDNLDSAIIARRDAERTGWAKAELYKENINLKKQLKKWQKKNSSQQ